MTKPVKSDLPLLRNEQPSSFGMIDQILIPKSKHQMNAKLGIVNGNVHSKDASSPLKTGFLRLPYQFSEKVISFRLLKNAQMQGPRNPEK